MCLHRLFIYFSYFLHMRIYFIGSTLGLSRQLWTSWKDCSHLLWHGKKVVDCRMVDRRLQLNQRKLSFWLPPGLSQSILELRWISSQNEKEPMFRVWFPKRVNSYSTKVCDLTEYHILIQIWIWKSKFQSCKNLVGRTEWWEGEQTNSGQMRGRVDGQQTNERAGRRTTNRWEGGQMDNRQMWGWADRQQTDERVGRWTADRREGGQTDDRQMRGRADGQWADVRVGRRTADRWEGGRQTADKWEGGQMKHRQMKGCVDRQQTDERVGKGFGF